jgi:MYXO-CTERM domain-containing protein
VSIEMDGGAAPPARVPWLIDATHNVCRWGVDATPSGELTAPAAVDTACAPPAPPVQAGGAAAGCATASTGAGPPATATKPSGCGCGTSTGADLALPLLVAALAGLRRRHRSP